LYERKVQDLELELKDANRKLSGADSKSKETRERIEGLEDEVNELRAQLQDRATDRLVRKLEANLKAKDTKMASLNESIKKLKEHIEDLTDKLTEETYNNNQRNAAAGGAKGADDDESKRSDDGGEDLPRVVSLLKDKVSSLQQRIARTKDEMEEVKARERRANDIRSTLQKEIDLLQEQLRDSESECKKHADMERRLHSENQSLKERNMSLASQVDLMKSNMHETGKGGSSESNLMKKVKLLEAQNAALRGAATIANSESKSRNESPTHKNLTHDFEVSDQVDTANEGKSNQSARSQWENEKRLKKRVEALGLRLAERTKEWEVATHREEQARELLNKSNQKIASLESQVAQLEKQAKGIKAAASGELQSVLPIREKMFELEEEVRRLTRIVNVDMPAERQRFDNERRLLERRAGDSEARADAVLRRIKESDGSDDIDKKLRSSENRFVVVEEMRDQVRWHALSLRSVVVRNI
jgi:chromosome segregation ATPase